MPFDLSIDSDAATVLDMSDADLAEVAAKAIETPRAQADIANGSAIGIRPAPLTIAPTPCDEQRAYPPQPVEREMGGLE